MATSSSSSRGSKPFTFLNLPPEVREMVYTHVFSHEGSSTKILVHEGGHGTGYKLMTTLLGTSVPGHKHHDQQNKGGGLSRTCRAIHRETSPHLRPLLPTTLAFRTDAPNPGHKATQSLPPLSRARLDTSSKPQGHGLFENISTMSVGATDQWRITSSLGPLLSALPNLQTVETVTIKRIPYAYWRERFPTILSRLLRPRAGFDLDVEVGVPEAERARFRTHVRAHPLINEDELALDPAEDDDDQEGNFADDRGRVGFCRRLPWDSTTGGSPTGSATGSGGGCGRVVGGQVRARWILVDRVPRAWVVRCVVETVFVLDSGKILDVRLVAAGSGSTHATPDADGTMKKLPVLRGMESLRELERRMVVEP